MDSMLSLRGQAASRRVAANKDVSAINRGIGVLGMSPPKLHIETQPGMKVAHFAGELGEFRMTRLGDYVAG
jgi:hypothetical protein